MIYEHIQSNRNIYIINEDLYRYYLINILNNHI